MTDRPFSASSVPLMDDAQPNGVSKTDTLASLDGAVPRSGGPEHPLISMPFTAYIDGRQFAGKALSLVEAQVSGLAEQGLEGGNRLVRLAFEFHGFSVSLAPLMRIERVSSGSLILHFTEPTGPHLPQLRYILNEYISGNLTTVGSVISAGTMSEPSGEGVRPPRESFVKWIISSAGTVFALVATAALLVTAWLLVDHRLFITEFQTPGHVIVEGETLRAVADGQIAFLDLEAMEGGVVVAIAATSGETLSLAMPCDCEVLAIGIREGSTVLSGEDLVRLIEPSAPVVIEAELPAMDAVALLAEGRAEFRFAGSAWRDATLLDRDLATVDGRGTVSVRFAPSEPLEAGRIGGFVEMRLVHDRSAFFLQLTERGLDFTR
ncbi:efflux RND transporter periplasmic adaptor subunit [Roseicyclus marinus]|uniref:hypothetical protein n=1 Tax=Roseicyclus marinus TaxID=2161673 RepID=UPI00240FC51D|nr:hypothetical protein [Roseicyclus marinus]MDG3042780.1 hypothetical protein [Roseicyclus marinus]